MTSVTIHNTQLKFQGKFPQHTHMKAENISFGYGNIKDDAAQIYDVLTPDNKRDRTATEIGAAGGAIALASKRVRRIISNQHRLSMEFVENFFKGLKHVDGKSNAAQYVKKTLQYFGEGGKLSFLGKAGKKLIHNHKILYILAIPVTTISIFLLGVDLGKKIEKQRTPEWPRFKDIRDGFNDKFSNN